MRYYFSLQGKMLHRRFVEFGVQPLVGYALVVLVFIGLSLYLFNKIDFAAYLYVFFGLSSISALSERRRNEFLETSFSKKKYLATRTVENMLMALPFAVFLLYKIQLLLAALLLLAAMLMAVIRWRNSFVLSIPTPFYKRPFEFAVGFRKTLLLFLLALFVLFQAIAVDNFNLGAFSLALVFLICMSFYSEPENLYYVWIFAQKPHAFLFEKIRTALLYTTILSFPILAILIAFYPENMWILMVIQCLGYLYLSAIILAKYSAYPQPMSVPQGLLLGASFALPPLLIVTIPFFYKKSTEQLKGILG